MTTERKRWWRKVAAVAVGGGVVAGGLFGIVRATAQPQKPPAAEVEESAWGRSAPVAPSVAEVERTPSTPATPAGAVTQVGGTLPAPVLPALPLPSGLEPVSGPRAPDAGLVASDKLALPAVPPVPTLDLPKVPTAPTSAMPSLPPVELPPTPSSAAPAALPPLPSLPGKTNEPPKAPVVAPPMTPDAPELPVVPQPAVAAPSLAPIQPAEPAPAMLPMKPDSGLNTTIPGNTLNPASPVAPAVPIAFPPAPGGRELPGTPVDRPKVPEPSFGTTDKFVFPAPAGRDPVDPTPRDSAMLKLNHAAALAVIGGVMFSAEQARSAPVLPLPPVVPGVLVKADAETDKLKDDLKAANKKIEALEKQVAKLTELLTGRKDTDGITVLPSDPGAVEEIKRLKNRIADLDTELKALRTQTTLKPAVVPETKPKGIVKVVNEYPVEISMVINDKSHRIAPNTKIEVEVPAGDFSYQLLQSGAATTRSVIKDKETVTLRIK